MKPASWIGTGIFVTALAIAGWCGPAHLGAAAWIAAAGLGAAFAWEAKDREPREWFRIDWAALAATYYLTLAEFLVPQPQFFSDIAPGTAGPALRLVLLGMSSLAIGRHLIPWPSAPLGRGPVLTTRDLIVLLVLCFALGNLFMFWTVHFNPVVLVHELLGPRFAQPWARERLGDSRALVSELQLLNYLVPPLTAWLLIRGELRLRFRIVLSAPLCFVLVAAFCGGTRYVLATHLATFAVASAWALRALPRRRALLLCAIPAFAILFVTVAALHFRHEGLGRSMSAAPRHQPPRRFIVDNNLRTLAQLTQAVPSKHDFLGWEVPLQILMRPLPRALFPAKPEKLSFSLEEVVPIPQTTIAATFIGEGYLMAGPWGSVLFGCALGALCSLWNRIPVGLGTPGPVILYASGFHWALLASRSPMWLSIGMLPGLAFVFAWTIAFPVARRLLPAQGERIHGSARL